jgi:uncharacterized membrane protein
LNLKSARFSSVFLYALVTGVFWGTWLSLSRSIASIRPQTFLDIGATMIQNLAVPMAILLPLTILVTLWVAILLARRRLWRAFYLQMAGLALILAALLVTLIVNVPIDNEIKHWTLEALPANWEGVRDHWETFHTIRTFESLAGFACVLASALQPSSRLEAAS